MVGRDKIKVNRIARFVESLGGRVVWRSGLRKRAKEKKNQRSATKKR